MIQLHVITGIVKKKLYKKRAPNLAVKRIKRRTTISKMMMMMKTSNGYHHLMDAKYQGSFLTVIISLDYISLQMAILTNKSKGLS